MLLKTTGPQQTPVAGPKFVFRKSYTNYYALCALYGARKQIMYVYSPWVLIELMGFRADTMSLLSVIGSFIGIFFMPMVGRLIDRWGVRKIMMIEALAFIAVYVSYGYLSAGLNSGLLKVSGAAVSLVFLLYIIDKMTAQFAMVRSIYIRDIAVTPEEITPSLSFGLSLDHAVSIIGSAVCGWIWYRFGPQYVFVLAGGISLINLLVARRIKPG